MKFEPNNKIVVLTGRRGCGKTIMLKHLLSLYKDHFNAIFLISPTEFNETYSKTGHIDKSKIFYEYNEEWVMNLIKKMEEVNTGKTKEDKDFKKIMLILDDCASDVRFHSSKIKSLRILATRGRHLGISCFLTTQDYKQVPPVIRNNIDYLIIGKLNRASLENIEKEFRAVFNKDEFIELLENNAGINHQFVIIDHTGVDNDDLYGIVKVENI